MARVSWYDDRANINDGKEGDDVFGGIGQNQYHAITLLQVCLILQISGKIPAHDVNIIKR